MISRLFMLTIGSLLLVSIYAYTAVPPPPRRSVTEFDHMIRQCFQTMCKEWMTECHWFCDSIKGESFRRRCMDCLGWRGEQCLECFDL